MAEDKPIPATLTYKQLVSVIQSTLKESTPLHTDYSKNIAFKVIASLAAFTNDTAVNSTELTTLCNENIRIYREVGAITQTDYYSMMQDDENGTSDETTTEDPTQF